ncbi:hypothetical protein ACN20G_15790 [Streptomyces sp. BI20]|uniref:hypothetical protein n=1 Tax=Streptomyces sp. BI20 TaxID=3403460 RepID=UPI003C71267E
MPQEPQRQDRLDVAQFPRLGDLAYDSARRATGVIIGLPTDLIASYHLVEEGGGEEWRAPGHGRTLIRPSDPFGPR